MDAAIGLLVGRRILGETTRLGASNSLSMSPRVARNAARRACGAFDGEAGLHVSTDWSASTIHAPDFPCSRMSVTKVHGPADGDAPFSFEHIECMA